MENQNEKLGQEPAFPTESKQEVIGNKSYTFTNEMGNTEIGYQNVFCEIAQDGMSKRFYAACEITKALITAYPKERMVNDGYIVTTDYPEIIKEAYELADELLRQEKICIGFLHKS